MDTVAESVYQIDPNGIPIKPGYRKPFNSETGREAAIKCARARAKLVEDANIARAALRQIHAMLNKPKRGSKPHLAGKLKQVSRDSQVSPKPGQISPTVRPISRASSSAVSPTAPVSPTVKPAPAPAKPEPAQDDDCLF